MNTVKNGMILTWIAINVIVLLNSEKTYGEFNNYLIGHIVGFVIVTSVGALLINFVGNKIIKRMRKKEIKT